MSVPEITVQELDALRKANADFTLLDVRNPDEYAICNLDGLLIPFKELATRLTELDRNQLIIVHCHSGGRSRRATELLLKEGFKDVRNLQGGITAWANEIDEKMAKY